MSDSAALVREHYTKVCKCEWTDDPGGGTRSTTSELCSIHGNVPDPLDVLVQTAAEARDALAGIVVMLGTGSGDPMGTARRHFTALDEVLS